MSAAARATALLLLALAAGGRAGAQAPVALVNGVAIPGQRLERFVEAYAAARGVSIANLRNPAGYKALRREALEALVDDELLHQEALRRGLRAGDEAVAGALAELRRRTPLPGAFEARLAAEGLGEAALAEQLRRQLTVRRLVEEVLAPAVRVEEDELHAFYLANQEAFRRAPGGAGGASPGGAPGEVAAEAEVRERIRERLRAERLEAAVRAQAAALRPGADIRLAGAR